MTGIQQHQASPPSKRKTTLVLGAGASCSYGFPTGEQLRSSILGLDASGRMSDLLLEGPRKIRSFQQDFRNSGMYSIDSFLSRRSEFVTVGKKAIAFRLLEAEANADLFSDGLDDNWYQYFVNEVCSDTWDELDLSWLSVITFNYDRSFEQYVTNAVMSIYGKSEQAVIEKLSAMPVVHVYGQLGQLSSDHGQVPFGCGGTVSTNEVQTAASSIEIIPEGRDTSVAVVKARQLLHDSERVCFLGFAHDAVNVRRLGAPDVFFGKNGALKRVFSTAYGMTEREQRYAMKLNFIEVNAVPIDRFMDCKCKEFLRRTLILR